MIRKGEIDTCEYELPVIIPTDEREDQLDEYFFCFRYQEALQLIGELLRELKKMDDKDLLVEVQLLESKVSHIPLDSCEICLLILSCANN